MTYYPNTRFFSGSNSKKVFNAEDAEDTEGLLDFPCDPCVLVV